MSGIRKFMTGLLKSIFGSKNEREVKKLWPHVKEINQIEEGLQKLTDDELRAKTAAWKDELSKIEDREELARRLEEILPEAFKVRLFKCFLDAAVSEQIARRVAMKAATENAGDIIKNITRLYNRARQAQITKEIAEVIGGAEALK